MLTANQVLEHLRAEGLIRGTAPHVTVHDLSRRNRNFRVTGDGEALFVKQNVDGARFLEREARAYRLAHASHSLAAVFPSLRHACRSMLVLALVPGETASRRARRTGRPSRRIARELGLALAAVHEARPRRWPGDAPEPWVLSLAAPPVAILRETSLANFDLLRITQSSAVLCRSLDGLLERWPRESAFIHGDIRLENILLSTLERASGVKVVDWEFSGRGDPAWDVGCAFASFLWLWLESLPFVPGLTLARLERSAAIPLGRVTPALASFWAAYRASRERAGPAFLARATRFAAARLVQIAFETMAGSEQLTGEIVCALQAAANLSAAPARAGARLARGAP